MTKRGGFLLKACFVVQGSILFADVEERDGCWVLPQDANPRLRYGLIVEHLDGKLQPLVSDDGRDFFPAITYRIDGRDVSAVAFMHGVMTSPEFRSDMDDGIWHIPATTVSAIADLVDEVKSAVEPRC